MFERLNSAASVEMTDKEEAQALVSRAKENLIDFSNVLPGLKAASVVEHGQPVAFRDKNKIIVYSDYVEYHNPDPQDGDFLVTSALAVDVSKSGLKKVDAIFAHDVTTDDSTVEDIVAFQAATISAKNTPLKSFAVGNPDELNLQGVSESLAGYNCAQAQVSYGKIDNDYILFMKESKEYRMGSYRSDNASDLVDYLVVEKKADYKTLRSAISAMVFSTRSADQINGMTYAYERHFRI